VTEGQKDMVIIDTPNGQVYRATWEYNATSLARRLCGEGFQDTRKMFLSCGAGLELSDGAWRVVAETARPQDYFDRAIAAESDNVLAVSGRAEAILTLSLFRSYVEQSLKLAKSEVERFASGGLPWRGEIVRGAISGCERNWHMARVSLMEARKQINFNEMDDVWSQLLILSIIDEGVDPDLGAARAGGKDGLEETQLGLARYMQGQYQQAMDDLLYAEEVSARAHVANFMGRFLRGCVSLTEGKADKAEELFRQCLDKWDIRGFLVVSLMSGAKREEAVRIAHCVREDKVVSAFQKALVEMAFGNENEAVEWLRKSYLAGDPWTWFIRFWPVLGALRENDEFKKLVDEIEAAKK